MTVGLHTDKSSRMSPEPTRCLHSCCFGISLRVGCFILGYLSLITNTIRMLSRLGLVIMIGIATNGFHDNIERKSGNEYEDSLNMVAIRVGWVLLIVLIINAVWLCVNIAVLIGLHKRRPGPIRLYVVFASIRLTLSIGEFVYLLIIAYRDIQQETIMGTIFEFFLCAYFICVYYTYAAQLEKEVKDNESSKTDQTVFAQEFTTEIAFIYPTKIDKEILIPPKGGLV